MTSRVKQQKLLVKHPNESDSGGHMAQSSNNLYMQMSSIDRPTGSNGRLNQILCENNLNVVLLDMVLFSFIALQVPTKCCRQVPTNCFVRHCA